MATFNRAYLDATEAFSRLKLEQARAEDAVNKIKATILLDKVPTILKTKGVGSSADARQAVIDSDPEYQAAKERVDMISAMLEFIKGKIKYLENCYTAVKKILDTNNFNMTRRAGKEQLDAILGAASQLPIGAERFGKAR